MLISLMFFLSATWHVYPYFYGSDIVFVFSWLTLLLAGPQNTGLPSLDVLFIQRMLSPRERKLLAPVISFFLGVSEEAQPVPLETGYTQNTQSNQGKGRPVPGNRRPTQQQNRYAMAQQQARSSRRDRKSTRLNSSHDQISYAVFCLKKKKNPYTTATVERSRTPTAKPEPPS